MQPPSSLVGLGFGIVGLKVGGLEVENLVGKVTSFLEIASLSSAPAQVQQEVHVQLLKSGLGGVFVSKVP